MRKPSFPSARKIYKVRMSGINHYGAGTIDLGKCKNVTLLMCWKRSAFVMDEHYKSGKPFIITTNFRKA